MLSKLKDFVINRTPPVEIGARGATTSADPRVLHDDDLDVPPNFAVHEEL